MFIRRKEDFTCDHCGTRVNGNGYTNHCPHCLYSKHVDNDPGDRRASCRGLMPPVAALVAHGEEVLVHECERCGHRKRNIANSADDKSVIFSLLHLGSET